MTDSTIAPDNAPIPTLPPEKVRCANCGASFRAEGGDTFRGLWVEWSWFCSQECRDEARML